MTKCQGCNATLPDGAAQCQFCGATLAPIAAPRGRAGGRQTGRAYTTTDQASEYAWVWWIYYGVAGWWILNGAFAIVSSVAFEKDLGGIFGIIGMIVGAFTALVGLGLILRVEAARGIVNVLCFIQILDGCFGLLVSFFWPGFIGMWGIIDMLVSVLRIAFAVLMIFAIGETESRAPNF